MRVLALGVCVPPGMAGCFQHVSYLPYSSFTFAQVVKDLLACLTGHKLAFLSSLLGSFIHSLGE